MSDNPLLEAALDYAARGIPVIPLHNPQDRKCSCGNPACDRIGKHPRTKRGILDATTDPGVIRSWWWSWPTANIGLAMGNGWAALDADHPMALEVWETQHGPLPDGPRQTTGKGEHRFFRTGDGVKNAVRFAPGLDIRSDRGYVVAAPSLHANGKRYEWDPDHTLDEPAPDLPAAIVVLCMDRARITQPTGHPPLDPALVLHGIEEGERNDTLYRYACRLLGFNRLTAVEAKPLVWQAGRACKPPIADDELETIFRSAAKHEESPLTEQPIPIETSPPPTFPLDALPDPLRSFAVETASCVQIPLDAVALMVLSALSVCTCRRVRVKLPTHCEWTNTYAVVALPPGSRKSAAFEAVFGVVWEMQSKWQAQVAPEVQLRKDMREAEEKSITAVKAKIGRAKSEDSRQQLLAELATIRANMTPEIHEPLIWIGGDVTQERLSQLLAQHGERLAIIDAEGTLFDLIAGLYSSRPNFDLLLKCWRGDPHRVERVGREAVQLQSPLVTLCITTQPSVIAGLADTKAFRGRGLLGRILFCVPPSLVGTRIYQHRAVDLDLVSDYNEAIRQTYRATWSDEHLVEVHNGALECWREFHDDVERRQALGGDLDDLPEFASKIAGIVAGIAGSLYMFEHRYGTPPGCVSDAQMQAAVAIGHWAIGHARTAAGIMTRTQEAEHAERILEWVRRDKLQTVTSRDVLRKFRTIKREHVEPALNHLISLGQLSPGAPAGPTGGRPRGLVYRVEGVKI